MFVWFGGVLCVAAMNREAVYSIGTCKQRVKVYPCQVRVGTSMLGGEVNVRSAGSGLESRR